jgi:cysteine desulfurase
MSQRIYLDHNATTPLAPEVVAAMRPFLTEAFGNPSSLHWAGLPARDAVETARSQVAALLCCDATEVVFTSGGTEANNLAIKGVYFAKRASVRRPHFITSRIEHPAVLEPCRFLETLGAEVTLLPVDRHGSVDPDGVRRAIRHDTVLVTIMHANNEVGTIEPIEEIVSIAHEHGILVHSDAAQTVGKIPVDVESLGVDLLSVAGHKLYGPKGVGALFIREGVKLGPLHHGAGHEAGRRAGTENVLEIVGLGAACELAQRWIDDPQITQLRDQFWRLLHERFDECVVLNGHPERRLPNTLNVSFRGWVGSEILGVLPEVAASTGSACHAGSMEMSPVLKAMGLIEEVGLGAVRFSLGRGSTADEVTRVVDQLSRLRKKAGLYLRGDG